MRRIKRKSKKKEARFRVGEYIEMESDLGLPPRGIYRVERVDGNFLHYSVGEFAGGSDLSCLKIYGRNLSAPESSLDAEIEYLEATTVLCDCSDCRQLLEERKERRSAQAIVH